MSNTDRFQRLDALFVAAARIPADERDAWLDARCDDESLKREVRELLAADRKGTQFLEEPAIDWEKTSTHESAEKSGDSVPETIGPYRIIRLIGEGGMGRVYEARQATPRRIVALKVLKAGIASSSALRRFAYEAQLLARLRHPGIAQVYDAGTHDDGTTKVPYFALEYVPNARMLTEYAAELELPAKLELFSRVCDAVHHGHQRGIIHRDLKPANILVDSSGQPRVIDFGVARATDSDLAVTTLQTDVGQLIGTLKYMSPEQCDADPHDLDTRSDVYSLGVVLYQLLCKGFPYDVGTTIIEAARVIREQAPKRPSSRTPLPADVETIVLKALEKDRARRYQSAAELGRDLQRYLNREPIEARPPSITYQLSILARRHRALVGVAAAAVVVLVAATIVSTVFAVQASRARKDSDLRRTEAQTAQLAEAEQRALAEKRFDEVRRLANTLIFELDAQLARLAGSTASRAYLVETAVQYLDDLAQDAADDPELLTELADAYARIADIQGNPVVPNLGRTDDAQSSYEKSLAMYDAIEAGGVTSHELTVRRASIYRKLGQLRRYTGEIDQAVADLHRALALSGAVRQAEPLFVPALVDLSAAHGMLGDLYLATGHVDQAMEEYRESLGLAELLIPLQPDAARAQRNFSISLIDVGAAFSRLELDEEAAPYFERAMAIRQALLDADPDNARAQRDLASALNRLGNVNAARGADVAALEYYERGRAIYDRQAAVDSENVALKVSQAVLHEKCGSTLLDLERYDEACTRLDQCVAIRRELFQSDPGSPRYQAWLAIAIERRSDVDLARGQVGVAADGFRSAISVLAGLDDQRLAIGRTVHAMAAHKLGRIHEDRAEWFEAERWYRESLQVLEEAETDGVRLQATPATEEEIVEAIERCAAPRGDNP